MPDTSLNQPTALAGQVGLLALLEDGLDALELGTGLFDANLRLVDCNRLFRKIRGYPASLCQSGTPLVELLKHDLTCGQLGDGGGKDPVHHWMEMAAKRRRHTVETKLDDGRVVAMTLTPIGDQGVILTVSDISQRTQATESLRAKQEWLDLVTEASSEGIYDWDVSSGNLKVSYRLTAMLGLLPGDLKASEWNKRIHPDDFAGYRAAIANHFKGESPYLKCEYRIRRHSGDYIWFADSGKCVRDGSGRACRLVGAVSDITARKVAEASLAQSEERHALAMRAVNEGVYDWNIEAGTIFYSDGVKTVLGLEPDQLKNPQDWVNRIHEDDVAGYRTALIAHFRGETPRFEREFRYRGSSGDWRWARQQGIARFNETGRAVRIIGATGDITDLKRTEIALRESDERYAQEERPHAC